MKTLLRKHTLMLITLLHIYMGTVYTQQSQFYGNTANGGEYDAGTIFKTDANGDNLSTLYSFFAFDGANPKSSLCLANNGKFYGTNFGGKYSQGILFEWNPITNAYEKKFDFNGLENGSAPIGSLIQSDNGQLYGMTELGGLNDCGIIYGWDPATGIFTKYVDFDGADKGKNPRVGKLFKANNGKFYGMTFFGGAYDNGVLFEWTPSNGKFLKLLDFDGIELGKNPVGSLIQAENGKLYGLTQYGGINNMGVLFEWDPATKIFTKKLDFSGDVNGCYPGESMIIGDNAKLIGITENGGINDAGVLFEWDPVLNVYTKKYDFVSNQPRGSLVQITNGNFFGVTDESIYEWDPIKNTVSNKFQFDSYQRGNGYQSFGSLVQATNGKLYGMTLEGGSNTCDCPGYGVIFEFDPINYEFIKKITFGQAENGKLPTGRLTQAANGKLYGLTMGGGAYDHGVLFEWDPKSLKYTKKMDFNSSETGGHPLGSLTKANNGKLYGLTQGGGAYEDKEKGIGGVLFEWDPFTNIYTKKIDFNGLEKGSQPYGTLLLASNGKLYGMTAYGGTYNAGVIFEWDPNTGYFSKKINFDREVTGSTPYGNLMQANNRKFYGMTNYGGLYNFGVLFEWDPVTNNYSKKLDFNGSENGRNPLFCTLIQSDNGKLYGVTNSGGINDFGVLFEWDPVNNIYTKKLDFDGINNGMYPDGYLMKSSTGKMFGSVSWEGKNNLGVLFEWDPATNIFTKKMEFNGANGTAYDVNLMELFNPNSVHTNIAFNKTVSQSSTQYGGMPERAVDGNTNGDWDNGSVTHTFEDENAWWEVDLGGIYNIETIEIWNRTNSCCMSRLSDYYLFASDHPFETKKLNGTLSQSNVWRVFKSDYPNPADTFMVGRTARYIRVQSTHSTEELNIAEVIVTGSLNKPQPVLTNIALNKPVLQSSTQYKGVPARAVDGNTNGNWNDGSVTHTYNDVNAWWEVDLGGIYNIETIEIWNRTNSCCKTRLSDFYVFASNEPFSSKQLNVTLNQPNIWQIHTSDYPDPADTLIVGRTARFIRVQSAHSAELNIAEVIVMGYLSKLQIGLMNVAQNKPVTQSSIKYGGIPERAVDGNTNGLWDNGSVTHTYYDKNAWWEVDLGGIYNINTIELWNRTNSCCRERLSDFYVLTSEVPFASKKLYATINQSNVWNVFSPDYPNPSHIYELNRNARYIRIQSDHSAELNIAEVVVMGTPTENTLYHVEKMTSMDTTLLPEIKIYPVPFTQVIYFESSEIIKSIEFLNIMGEALIMQKCGKSFAELNTDLLMPGLYIVRLIMENDKIHTYKVIKNNR